MITSTLPRMIIDGAPASDVLVRRLVQVSYDVGASDERVEAACRARLAIAGTLELDVEEVQRLIAVALGSE